MTSTCHLTVVAPELISKLKFYEPEEEVRENCQGLKIAPM